MVGARIPRHRPRWPTRSGTTDLATVSSGILALALLGALMVLVALFVAGEQAPRTLGGPREPCWWVTDANPQEPGSACASPSLP